MALRQSVGSLGIGDLSEREDVGGGALVEEHLLQIVRFVRFALGHRQAVRARVAHDGIARIGGTQTARALLGVERQGELRARLGQGERAGHAFAALELAACDPDLFGVGRRQIDLGGLHAVGDRDLQAGRLLGGGRHVGIGIEAVGRRGGRGVVPFDGAPDAGHRLVQLVLVRQLGGNGLGAGVVVPRQQRLARLHRHLDMEVELRGLGDQVGL